MIVTGNKYALAVAIACFAFAASAKADGPALTLRTKVAVAGDAPLTIEVNRWSTDAERAPLLAALAAPAPAPPAGRGAAPGRGGAAPARGAAEPARGATDGAAGARAGRAGRGGARGGAAAPPLSPLARLTNAIKAAPTVGFLWPDGVTGYSIKYAWRAAASAGGDRIVLVTDRRLGANAPDWPAPAAAMADAEFTVLEFRLDPKGVGEGKSSLTAGVVVDEAAKTLALDGYAAVPVLLRVGPQTDRSRAPRKTVSETAVKATR